MTNRRQVVDPASQALAFAAQWWRDSRSRPDRTPGHRRGIQQSVLDHGHSVHDHVLEARGRAARVPVGRLVADPPGIEGDDVGVGADL